MRRMNCGKLSDHCILKVKISLVFSVQRKSLPHEILICSWAVGVCASGNIAHQETLAVQTAPESLTAQERVLVTEGECQGQEDFT